MSSRHEAFGLVLIEAMEAGLPVCGTNAGGVPDILIDDPDSLVSVDCVASLAAGLRVLHEAPRRVWDMSRFRIDNAAREVEAFYRRFC